MCHLHSGRKLLCLLGFQASEAYLWYSPALSFALIPSGRSRELVSWGTAEGRGITPLINHANDLWGVRGPLTCSQTPQTAILSEGAHPPERQTQMWVGGGKKVERHHLCCIRGFDKIWILLSSYTAQLCTLSQSTRSLPGSSHTDLLSCALCNVSRHTGYLFGVTMRLAEPSPVHNGPFGRP